MNKMVTSIFAYIGVVFWLIAYIAGDKEGAKFHLNQGLILAIAGVVASILSYIPVIWILGSIISVVCLVFAILGIISAVKGEEKPLPVIGNIKILK